MHEPFKRARGWFTALLIIEVLMGMSIITTTFFYQRNFSLYWIEADRPLMFALLFSSYVLGFQLTITYICSYVLWRRVWPSTFSTNVEIMLTLWMFFCFVIVLSGLGTIWALYNCVNSVVHATEKSLRQGIDLYYSCPEWKLLWDNLQYQKECCGIFGYDDWMKAEWMPSEPKTCQMNSSVILAPYACCQHNCQQCFEKYMPHAQSTIPQLELNQINTAGCLQAFTDTLWSCVYLQIGIMIIALKLDICVCIFTKFIMSRQDICIEIRPACNEEETSLLFVKCPSNSRLCISEEEPCCSQNCISGKTRKKRRTKPHNPCNDDESSSCKCSSCVKLTLR